MGFKWVALGAGFKMQLSPHPSRVKLLNVVMEGTVGTTLHALHGCWFMGLYGKQQGACVEGGIQDRTGWWPWPLSARPPVVPSALGGIGGKAQGRGSMVEPQLSTHWCCMLEVR